MHRVESEAENTTSEYIFNNLTRPDGSALMSQKQTIIQAAAYGPFDIPPSKINYEEAVVEVMFKRKISMSISNPLQAESREIENFIKTTFQYVLLTRLHPRTLVSIIVQEIFDGGSIVSAAVTSTCCALLDSGLPMRCVAAGVTVITTPIIGSTQNGQDSQPTYKFIIQPTKDQETSCLARFDLVLENHSYKLIAIKTQGKYDQSILQEAIRLARLESERIFNQINDNIRAHFRKRVRGDRREIIEG